MTKEEKDKLFKLLVEARDDFSVKCNRRIAEECGKITGADYMLQRLLDVIGVDKDEECELVDLRRKAESEDKE